MKPSLRTPAAALAVALGVLLVTVVLDRGSPRSRDAALIVGSLALYALIPVAAVWLVIAVVRHRRSVTVMGSNERHRLTPGYTSRRCGV